MNNVLSFIIVTLCLTGLGAQAQADQTNKPLPPSKKVHIPKAGKTFRDCPYCPEMMVIPTGSFEMGSQKEEKERSDDEGPVHQVKIKGFALSRDEVTRGQFAVFVKKANYNAGDKCWTFQVGKFEERNGRNWRDLGFLQNDKHPAACISWNDAKAYTQWISQKTGKQYRLPTEAEWEFAARANTSTARYWGNNPDEACGYANTADKTAQKEIGTATWSAHNCTDGFPHTAPVGSFKANAFRLNDMLGNVWEWTEDSYHDSYADASRDGSAWEDNPKKRVLRGGSWNNGPEIVRAAKRGKDTPATRISNYGFRIARNIP